MSCLPNLDRFAVGLADPQKKEPKRLGRCANKGCIDDITSGYEAFVWDGKYFCSTSCFGEYMGIEEVEWD